MYLSKQSAHFVHVKTRKQFIHQNHHNIDAHGKTLTYPYESESYLGRVSKLTKTGRKTYYMACNGQTNREVQYRFL